jgi:hypothetical protein
MMLVRLGNVLYWLGCILAALIIGLPLLNGSVTRNITLMAG